ncbi:M14 family zinc carboxypeptidase [Microlunatus ginsengisoli]|uniref:Peptidase M14 domain-containing protein n=1 Tax=Microlunatus ginsengisoli TaxID=363863 RepID=A0ABP6ZLR4_9ACTN
MTRFRLPLRLAVSLIVLLGVITASALLAPPLASAASYPNYGQRNAAVWSLQKKLVEAGVLRADRRTGYFGTHTRSAVKTIQKRSRLAATGKLDAPTARAVDKAVAAMTGPRTWYHRETIGTSAEGRKIVAYRAGQPGKPVVVVTATMHGEEDFGQYVVRGLMEGKPITGVDLWLVPVLNPDGLAKDRRWLDHRVDLNRNFPNRFVVRANSGPKAASAKETRAVMSFLDRVQPRYLVSWHQPLYGVDSYRVKDKALMKRLSAGLALPVKSLNCHGSCHGTMTGWYNANHAGAAITVEYGAKARSMKRMKGKDADAVLAAVGGRRG